MLKVSIIFVSLLICLSLKQVHDEREMGRVLGIEGIELVGINNRSLGNAAFVNIASADIFCLRTSSRRCDFCCGKFRSVEESHK